MSLLARVGGAAGRCGLGHPHIMSLCEILTLRREGGALSGLLADFRQATA
jgi:hypothetical protein